MPSTGAKEQRSNGMQRSRFAWWPLHRGGSFLSREPGAAMFRGLRINLTLWYCGVLAIALVLFGVALYLGTQHYLFDAVESDAQMHARGHIGEWLMSNRPLDRACPSFQSVPPPGPMPEMVVCFN